MDRPLIDVRVTTFLAPCEMAGAQLGVLLNQMLPSLVIFAAMVTLTLTLTLTLTPTLTLALAPTLTLTLTLTRCHARVQVLRRDAAAAV